LFGGGFFFFFFFGVVFFFFFFFFFFVVLFFFVGGVVWVVWLVFWVFFFFCFFFLVTYPFQLFTRLGVLPSQSPAVATFLPFPYFEYPSPPSDNLHTDEKTVAFFSVIAAASNSLP